MKKSNLYLMCGVAGSGKSTWLKEHESGFNPSHAIVSRDKIRFSYLKDGDDYFAYEKEVWKDFVSAIKTSLEENVDTFVDATHLNEKNRAKLLRALGSNLKGVSLKAIVMNTSLEKTLERNSQRTGRALVPESEIRSMYASFTDPTFEEGFEAILIVHENGDITIKKERK